MARSIQEAKAEKAAKKAGATPAAAKAKAKAVAAPEASTIMAHRTRLGLQGPRATNTAAATKFMSSMAALKVDKKSVLANDYIEPCFPFGSIVLDHVLGLDGIYRRGRIYSFHGPMHTGKSTMCYQAGAAWQHFSGEGVVLFDTEGQLDLNYIWSCGMDPALTRVIQAVDADEIIRIAKKMMEDDACHFFIIDSIARLRGQDASSSAQDEKAQAKGGKVKKGPPQPGVQARLVSYLLDTLQPLALKSESVIAMVNQEVAVIPQTREEMNAVKYQTISNPSYSLKGGKAAQYHPTVMVQTAKVATKDGTTVAKEDVWLYPVVNKNAFMARTYAYNKTLLKVLKNKSSAGGYREYHIWVRPGQGIDDWISVRELARRFKLIDYVGGKWVIGDPAAPLATYPNQDAAVHDLVYAENMDVLIPLRDLVINAIKGCDPRAFAYEPTLEEKYMAGETDVVPPSRVVEFEDDGDGMDGEDVTPEGQLEADIDLD